MEGGIYKKFQEPIYFTLSYNQNSLINYRHKNLYYTKFKSQTFSALINQYKDLTGSQMLINFHGLIIKPELLIEEIIETKEEERVFQYVINRSQLSQLTIPKKWCQSFNKIIHRIIKSGLFIQQVKQKPEIKDNIKEILAQYQLEKNEKKSSSLQKSQGQSNKKEQKMSVKQLEQVQIDQKNLLVQGIRPLLIYWVDDEPKNNIQIIETQLSHQQIEIKQVTSTQQMTTLLQVDYQLQKKLGRRVLFISDMARLQKSKMNYEAGIDLFEYIYQTKKLKDPGIAFVSNKQKTLTNMLKRNLNISYLKILNETNDLVAEVKKYLMQIKM